MLLLAVIYLDRGQDDLRNEINRGFTEIRGEISYLGERMARVETKSDNIDQRIIRFEGILDGQRPPATK